MKIYEATPFPRLYVEYMTRQVLRGALGGLSF